MPRTSTPIRTGAINAYRSYLGSLASNRTCGNAWRIVGRGNQRSMYGKWVGFRGISADRYKRGINEENDFSDPYLLEVATGRIERLVTNEEVAESSVSFSPDGR